jgi:TonB-dependent receptor
MAKRTRKNQTKSSLVVSVVVHVLALGAIAYFAHRAGWIPPEVYKITGIKAPEKPKPKPKPPEPPPEVPPQKPPEIAEPTTEPPPQANTPPPTAPPATVRQANPGAPPAQGGAANNFFQAEVRKPGATPAPAIQGKPGTGAGNLEKAKSTAAATTTQSAFSEAATRPSTVESVLEERKSAAAAQEAISAEQISRTGGGDVAQLTTKITGVVAVEGKQLVVRGLNDRYNVATLNGSELPSADPRRRSPNLDLIPSAMVDRVVVSKTFTPDMQGGFAGGAVNIVTKSFPAQAFTTLTVGTGVNSIATFNDGFLNSEAGSLDWLGIDDGGRKAPTAALAANNTLRQQAEAQWRNDNERQQRLEAAQRYDAGLRSFTYNSFAPTLGSPGPNANFTLASGDSTWLFGRRFGWFGTLTYDRRFSMLENAVRNSGFTFDVDEFDGGPLLRRGLYTRNQSTEDVNWGAVASMAMEVMPGHELSFNFLHNQSGQRLNIEEEGRTRNQLQPGTEDTTRIYQTSFFERFLRNGQFKGRHELRELGGAQLDWTVSMASTAENTPDQRFFPVLAFPRGDGTFDFQAQSTELPNINQPTRFFRNSKDSSLNGRIDLTVPFTPGNGLESALKLGFNTSSSERRLREQRFDYQVSQELGQGLTDPRAWANQVLNFTGPRFTTNVTSATRGRYRFQEPFFNPAAPPFDGYGYDGSQDISAGYAMMDLFVHPKLRLIGGARIETTDLQATALPLSRIPESPFTGQIKVTDVLPSVNLVVPIKENLNLRLSWSQTIARPTYREFAPFEYFDPGEGLVYRGFPGLQRTQIENYDARVEWFPGSGALFSIGYFYKTLTDPIEPVIIDTALFTTSFQNRPNAIVRGIEMEARKDFSWLDPLLEQLTLGLNFSYINSVVDVNYDVAGTPQQYTRPLFDQPEYVLNADLTWEFRRLGATASIVYARTGQRLAIDGGSGPNYYERPIDTLDLFLTKRFGQHWRLRLGARNLLDPKITQVPINDLGSEPITYGERYIFRQYQRGLTYSLSITREF